MSTRPKKNMSYALSGMFGVLVLAGLYANFLPSKSIVYKAPPQAAAYVPDVPKVKPFVVTHLAPPTPTKGIYMTSCVAATPSVREKLVALISDTEINAIVIDVKDYTGMISFNPTDEALKPVVSKTCSAGDMKEFIGSLHDKGIYVIGRIAVFQDTYLTRTRPDLAVKKRTDTSVSWKDFKGLSFTDPGAQDVWKYHVLISKEAYAIGFDELNFDYIRYPSDGPMEDIYYPWSDGRKKTEVLGEFFAFLSKEIKPIGVILSADLFGMTTTNSDDLNIGQKLEVALPYFDFIDPMVYPSHYPKNFLGFDNPAAYPYEVVKYSMDSAVKKVAVFNATVASTSPLKIRPWLQDFNLGATYTADKVQAQMKATYDAGLTSWILWNASNRYTKEALMSQPEIATSTPL